MKLGDERSVRATYVLGEPANAAPSTLGVRKSRPYRPTG